MRCELALRALNLVNVSNKKLGSTSSPFAVVTHMATTPGDVPKVLGQTEECKNNLNPSWNHLFRFEYLLGTPMKLYIQIFDKDDKRKSRVNTNNNSNGGSSTTTPTYKLMGAAYFDVGLILGSPGRCRAKKLIRGGIMIAQIRKGTGSGELRLKLKGIGLKNVEGFMKKSDPFYEIYKRIENKEGFIEWERVYRSKTIMDNLNPTWPEVVIDVLSLGDGNLNHPIKIMIFDHNRSGNHEFIGELQLSVNRLIDASTEGVVDKKRALPISQSKSKGHKAKEIFAGKLLVLEAHVSGVSDHFEEMAGVQVKAGVPLQLSNQGKCKPNFMDYVIGGCEFNVCIAVDFTGSNGDPLKPGTLHYLDPQGGFNDYEKSIVALLNVLGRYDTDKHFALWGFGAKYNGEVYNIFQCGRRKLIPGMEGVLQAYRDQFRSGITMAKTPTVFLDVLRTAAAHARRAARIAEQIGQQEYTILIILTDGDVEDPAATMAELDEASNAPLSVIFVGIGEQDFSNMRFIDDGRDLRTRRDIATFVPFNEHSKDSQKFTSEATQEIPQQLTDYFESKGIKPLPETTVPDKDLVVMPAEPELDVQIAFDGDGVPSLKRGGIEYHNIFQELIGSNQD